jgi:hypothetical protein
MSSKFRSVIELGAEINNAVPSVAPQMLEVTWREIEYCLDILGALDGLTLRCTEPGELFFQVEQTNSLYVSLIVLSVLCVREIWPPSVCVFLYICICPADLTRRANKELIRLLLLLVTTFITRTTCCVFIFLSFL